jgi:hypothetical protein
MSDVKLTRQGVRDLNQLPGRKVMLPRAQIGAQPHNCRIFAVWETCISCESAGHYLAYDFMYAGSCTCGYRCRTCGRKL